jgi:hypothetical protein
MYMHSVNSLSEIRMVSPKVSGEKVLIKALAAIVNREGKKKTPIRRINLCSSELPWL